MASRGYVTTYGVRSVSILETLSELARSGEADHLDGSSSTLSVVSAAPSVVSVSTSRSTGPRRRRTPDWIKQIFEIAKEGSLNELKRALYDMDSTLIRNLSDHRGNSLLHVVCSSGHQECLSWLCFVCEGKEGLFDENQSGVTPVMCCIRSGRLDCLEMLVRHTRVGDMLRVSNGERSLLHYAAKYGQDALVEWLIEEMQVEDLDVDQRDLGGNTPLHLAARGGHITSCSLLLWHGANPAVKNDMGYRSYDCSMSCDQTSCAQYLLLFEAVLKLGKDVVDWRKDIHVNNNKTNKMEQQNNKHNKTEEQSNGMDQDVLQLVRECILDIASESSLSVLLLSPQSSPSQTPTPDNQSISSKTQHNQSQSSKTQHHQSQSTIPHLNQSQSSLPHLSISEEHKLPFLQSEWDTQSVNQSEAVWGGLLMELKSADHNSSGASVLEVIEPTEAEYYPLSPSPYHVSNSSCQVSPSPSEVSNTESAMLSPLEQIPALEKESVVPTFGSEQVPTENMKLEINEEIKDEEELEITKEADIKKGILKATGEKKTPRKSVHIKERPWYDISDDDTELLLSAAKLKMTSSDEEDKTNNTEEEII